MFDLYFGLIIDNMKRQGRKRRLSPETLCWLHGPLIGDGVTIVDEQVVSMGVEYIDALIKDFSERIRE